MEDGALHGVRRWVGADDDSASAVAEQGHGDGKVEVGVVRWNEQQELHLSAGHEHAGATVVLGDVLGDAERREPSRAAVEVEQGAAHGQAEAEQPR